MGTFGVGVPFGIGFPSGCPFGFSIPFPFTFTLPFPFPFVFPFPFGCPFWVLTSVPDSEGWGRDERERKTPKSPPMGGRPLKSSR